MCLLCRLQISIQLVYSCQVGGCSVAALARQGANRTGSVAWVVLFLLTFDPFFAMPAVTIAFKYDEQALQLYQLSLTGVLSWGSFVWFWCWSLVDFPSPLLAGNFRSQEWTHQFDLDLNASILDLKSALAFTRNQWNDFTKDSLKRPARGKGKKHRPGFYQFLASSLRGLFARLIHC